MSPPSGSGSASASSRAPCAVRPGEGGDDGRAWPGALAGGVPAVRAALVLQAA